MTGPGIRKSADPGVRARRVERALVARGLAQVVRDAARFKHVTLREVCSRTRTAPVVAGRFEAWARLYAMGLSYPAIAAIFEMDHASVIYGVHKVRKAAA